MASDSLSHSREAPAERDIRQGVLAHGPVREIGGAPVIVMATFRQILILVVDQIRKAEKLWMQGTLFGRTRNFDWAIANRWSFSGREIFA